MSESATHFENEPQDEYAKFHNTLLEFEYLLMTYETIGKFNEDKESLLNAFSESINNAIDKTTLKPNIIVTQINIMIKRIKLHYAIDAEVKSVVISFLEGIARKLN